MSEPSLSLFGFTQSPFTKEVADSELWLPPSKQQLVDELVDSLQQRHNVLLVGEPGVGKTCVLRALRQRLPTERFRLTYCHNATLGRRDFYRQLCLALGLSPKATAAAVFYAVTSHVQELASSRLHPVFLLDEAHLLHSDVLAHLHILLNYEWDSRALLSLVLVGLPELQDRLSLGTHTSLLSRLHSRLLLEPVTPDDSANYLRHRLRLAGCDRELFPREAVALLHESCQGAHRDLDRLASLCLRQAARRKRKLVDSDTVREVLERQHSPALA
ncbi:AAA family ATPase [Archangium sp.]|uniref:ExeA family protein n=1 Tax=Archangium sp. TaxID=1872627 RepID=UPI00286A92B8|nr:AAA family ATPase [Archangium sp.]